MARPSKTTREQIGARLRFEILRRCNFACYYCGVPASFGMKVLHVDHVVPVDLGGTNDPWNLVAACWDCNAGKTNGVPTDDLIRQVRGDYCAYLVSTGLEAQPCVYCSLPVVRECPEEERPLRDDDHCGICDSVFFDGYDVGKVHGYQAGVTGNPILLPKGALS